MKGKNADRRLAALAAGFGLILFVFVMRLMNFQIVHGEEYRQMANSSFTREQTIESARGEIVDRDGNALAANAVTYDIILDRAFLPREEENEIILATLELLELQGEEWNDPLPMTREAPYAFLEGEDAAVSRLKAAAGVGDYSDAQVTYERLLENYGLLGRAYDSYLEAGGRDYTDDEKRLLAGVKYGMEEAGFSVRTPYVLATDVTMDTVTKIRERSSRLQGVDYQQSTARVYVDGSLAPHILGHIGLLTQEEYETLREEGYSYDDEVGKEGIELSMESYLRGQDGTRQLTLNSSGDVLESTVTQAATPGNRVVLTIDSTLQRVAQKALEEQIINLQQTAQEGRGREADAGCAVVVDVKTGDVLAAVNAPTYDLETYRQEFASLSADPLNPMWNRAFMGQYRPGSCFKPCVAVAGLAEGVITPSTTVNCTGVYTYYDDYRPTCLSAHGNLTVYSAIAYSCNIFFYETGRRLGIDLIDEYAQDLGMGQATGVEIAEATGVLSSPEFTESHGGTWYPGNVLQASIGQLDTALTPAQMASYVATIANKGTRMKLNLVKRVETYDGSQVILENNPTVLNEMDVEESVFETVRDAMVQTSRTGSASGWFGSYPIDVASKTGTPETLEQPNSTFICFAPAEDPQIAIAVVIEKGWHGYTGAPVARAIMDQYFFGENTLDEEEESGEGQGETAEESQEAPSGEEASGEAESSRTQAAGSEAASGGSESTQTGPAVFRGQAPVSREEEDSGDSPADTAGEESASSGFSREDLDFVDGG